MCINVEANQVSRNSFTLSDNLGLGVQYIYTKYNLSVPQEIEMCLLFEDVRKCMDEAQRCFNRIFGKTNEAC